MTVATQYDVIVVGGGPAGMMAAGRAAECGAKVVLIEKNRTLGKKLLITGGGRCNITNAEFDTRKMVSKYGPKGKALFGSFARFGVEDTLNFFESKNLLTKTEAEKRAFPISNKAVDVRNVLVEYMRQGGVTVLANSSVLEVLIQDSVISGIKTTNGILHAKKYIIATGGKSRPETGSTGEGFLWLKN